MKKHLETSPESPTAKIVPTPRFSAGTGEPDKQYYGHEFIEGVLHSIGFDERERKAIYFGNWLRDYSQVIDPKTVRAENAPVNFPNTLSRDVLTELVNFLALKEFHILQDTEEGRRDYTVTRQMLGVYRPSEHIDNPINLDANAADPRLIDPDFEPLIGPDHELAGVHEQRSIALYIPPARRYMRRKLLEAMREGKTPSGMRALGEALHVLEDYYAHSNFVELALRKSGYKNVLVWTTEKKCKHRWPVVTGQFGGTDTAASIAELMAKQLRADNDPFTFKPIVSGARSDLDHVLLILLKEVPSQREQFVRALEQRDRLAENATFKFLEYAIWITTTPYRLIGSFARVSGSALLTLASRQIGEVQAIFGDPNTEENVYATHAQLAKDRASHPFHTLAQLLARHAVFNVGQAIYKYWEGDHSVDPVSIANNHFRHPNDLDWPDEVVKRWAQDNSDKIRQGSSAGILEENRIDAMQAELDRLEALGAFFRESPNTAQEIIGGAFPFG